MSDAPKLNKDLQDQIAKKVEDNQKIAEAKDAYDKGAKHGIQEELKKKAEHREKINEEIEKGKKEYEAKKADLKKEIEAKAAK